jgi:hypothetical protein
MIKSQDSDCIYCIIIPVLVQRYICISEWWMSVDFVIDETDLFLLPVMRLELPYFLVCAELFHTGAPEVRMHCC